MKTLKSTIEKAIENAFYAGAEWHALVHGMDSAKMPGHMRPLTRGSRYQSALKRQQQNAVESVGSAILRVRLAPKDGEV